MKEYKKLYDTHVDRKGTVSLGRSGKWHKARPESYRSIWFRIESAWHVLIGKADALYWRIDTDN